MKKLFDESNIDENKSDYQQSKSDYGFEINILDINFSVASGHIVLLKRYPTNRANIPVVTLKVNNNQRIFGLPEAIGIIKAAPNQPAERLTNKSERIVDQTELITIKNNLTGQLPTVNASGAALSAELCRSIEWAPTATCMWRLCPNAKRQPKRLVRNM